MALNGFSNFTASKAVIHPSFMPVNMLSELSSMNGVAQRNTNDGLAEAREIIGVAQRNTNDGFRAEYDDLINCELAPARPVDSISNTERGYFGGPQHYCEIELTADGVKDATVASEALMPIDLVSAGMAGDMDPVDHANPNDSPGPFVPTELMPEPISA